MTVDQFEEMFLIDPYVAAEESEVYHHDQREDSHGLRLDVSAHAKMIGTSHAIVLVKDSDQSRKVFKPSIVEVETGQAGRDFLNQLVKDMAEKYYEDNYTT